MQTYRKPFILNKIVLEFEVFCNVADDQYKDFAKRMVGKYFESLRGLIPTLGIIPLMPITSGALPF